MGSGMCIRARNEWVGASGGTCWNANGDQLFDVETRFQLRVLNTFGSEAAAGPAWFKPGSALGARIDYLLV